MFLQSIPRAVAAGGGCLLLTWTLSGCSHSPASGSEATVTAAAPGADVGGAAGTPRLNATSPVLSAATPVEIERGTRLKVRLDRALDSSTASAGESFHGTLEAPVLVNGEVALPQGAEVSGRVVAADAAGQFKGQSRLELTLSGVRYQGEHYELSTQAVTRLAASRSTRSGEAIGGGAAVGALIGVLAGNGKGAAVGALSGAGAGTAAQALTKPAEVNLPAETVIRFELSAPVQVVPANRQR